jgi:hypothetical protein
MKNIIALLLLFSVSAANSSVVINSFSMSETSLSFDVAGTVTKMGTDYQHQLMFGLIDNNDDWITSYDSSSSSFTSGATNARDITGRLYSLSSTWTDSLLTVGEYWQLGDIIDLSFNFVGVFNLANFDADNFGMSVGMSAPWSIVPSSLNLVTAVNELDASVSEPASIALLGLGLLGLGYSRRKSKV